MTQHGTNDPGALSPQPWVIVGPTGLAYIGLHFDEEATWQVFLGWPSDDEIASYKSEGWYAAPAVATWRKP